MKEYWKKVYHTKSATEVSWFKPHLDESLKLILKSAVNKNSHIIDVGGGASTLVDDLIEKGFHRITVLDLSSEALDVSKSRLGARASEVEWLEGDITQITLPECEYDIWHDRAVFHFLTKPEDRKKYVDVLRRSVKDAGHVIMAAFDQDGGPLRCSGLDVMRYNAETLQAELGPDFQLIESSKEEHHTPFQTMQKFIYCHFIKGKRAPQ